MNVLQDDLNLWRRFFETLRVGMLQSATDLATGEPGYRGRVRDMALKTASAAARMGFRLEQAGAERPAELAPRPETPLALLDTPANRRYAEKLREAWEAGLAVDRERYGESIGTDGCAQVIEMVLADVEEEIGGAVGAGLE